MSPFAKSALTATTVILAGFLGMGVAWLLLGAWPSHQIQATVLQAPRPLPEFSLLDHDGNAFEREELTGRWSLVFFGFTNCPDICPLTLQKVGDAARSLTDVPLDEFPRLVFISVDPMRDTPERLKNYVSFFHEDFVGVTGTLADVQSLTRALGVATSYVANEEGDDYTVDHTASLFLVNPRGELKAILGTPHEPGVIEADYRAIVAMNSG